MQSCQRSQGELLDYVYDLLEEGERRTLQEHLEDCDSCRSALAQAQQHQRLLATAAKHEFPSVRFETPNGAQPQTIRFSRPVRHAPMLRWLAAASVLIAVGGALVWFQQSSKPNVPVLPDGPLAKADGAEGGNSKVAPGGVGPSPTKYVFEPTAITRRSPDDSQRGPTVDWGVEKDGLRARVLARKQTFKVGGKIDVQCRIMNINKEPRVVWDSGFWPNHQLVVLDQAGKEVPRTAVGEQGRAAFAPGGSRDKNVPVTLKQGGTNDATQDLSQLFVLDKPGKYSVYFVYEEKQPTGWHGRIESNLVTITLVK